MHRSVFLTCMHTGVVRVQASSVLSSFRGTQLIIILAGFIVCSSAEAQVQRLELGRRLQRFEHAWDTADTNQRAACVEPLKAAVNNFFSLRLNEAGRQLDSAWQSARGIQPTVFEQGTVGLQILATPVCADAEVTSIRIELKPFYDSKLPVPADSSLHLQIRDRDANAICETSVPVSEAMMFAIWETGALPAGDHRLSATVKGMEESFTFPDVTISRVDRLSERLKHLKEVADSLKSQTNDAIDSQPESANATIAATLLDASNTIQSVSQGKVQETDYPVLSRLEFCEHLAKTAADPSEKFVEYGTQKDIWLVLSKDRRTVPTRLRCPENINNPVPVLFVFHGAGGSENMFFETYGAGRVIREAERRGWLVVSPRQGLFGLSLDITEMLDALTPFIAVNRSRVLLLGHSMGAGQVLQQVQKHPELPLAAAALGGGRRFSTKEPQKHSRIIWFVAAGDEDFGKQGARQLHEGLRNAGVRSSFKIYPDVEHLVVVQAAIDDVFAFYDEVLKQN
ncbi:MAG: dienelactone hydrolase family protein [Planctomyces sp.]|nr:dienelactone hydrolase family protein [Planctomyces sp.]